jgi:hypothetical protein
LRVLTSAPILLCFGYFILVSVQFIAMQGFGITTNSLYGVSAALASAALTTC